MRRPVMLATIALVWTTGRLAGAGNDSQPQLVILVHDFAGLSNTILESAEAHATMILKDAGVQLLWRHCPAGPEPPSQPDACPETPAPAELVLQILPKGATRHQTEPNVFGFALPSEGDKVAYYAAVFYDRIAATVRTNRTAFVLGNVISHEIGHLLLGAGHHSDAGIMQSEWSHGELELMNMRFSRPEHNLIVVNAKRRDAMGTQLTERAGSSPAK
jgi:hypothetical protein